MSHFDLGNGLFFSINVSTRTYVIEQKVARETGPTLINDDCQIKINAYNVIRSLLIWCATKKRAFLWKLLLFVRDCGVTTQRSSAILGNRSKKVEKLCSERRMRIFTVVIN